MPKIGNDGCAQGRAEQVQARVLRRANRDELPAEQHDAAMPRNDGVQGAMPDERSARPGAAVGISGAEPVTAMRVVSQGRSATRRSAIMPPFE